MAPGWLCGGLVHLNIRNSWSILELPNSRFSDYPSQAIDKKKSGKLYIQVVVRSVGSQVNIHMFISHGGKSIDASL